MGYVITIDTSSKRAVVRAEGHNDLETSLAAMDELAARADFLPGYAILCDFRTNDYTPGTSESSKLAEAYASRFGGRPMAVVVSSLLHYGIANMITTIVRLRGSPVAAFREIDEAEAWLREATGQSQASR
ncbi:MAG TPA: hypothetical protein VFV19_00660 [Candidatus Polarisedimenticolaceae bacterium]|nr:hypothetical protein [Candidatus Polarisedimenticolaceae bacterium]